MLQVLNNTIIKPIKDYYNLSNVSNLNNNSESITCDNLNQNDNSNNDDNDDNNDNNCNDNNKKEKIFKDFDSNWVDYENVYKNIYWEGYFDKNGQLRSMESKTDEYEKLRYDAQYIRKNKIFEFIDKNNLCKLNCPLIEGSYYISPTNDIYKINWEFYKNLKDILDHSNLFEVINDEKTKNLLINLANEFEKNDKLFQESMKDINNNDNNYNFIKSIKSIIYEKLKNYAQYIRRNKIYNFIDKNNLCKLNYPLIEGSYYISPTNDIYKINFKFYENLKDILDHSNLFEVINDEKTKNLLINSANEFKKNDKLFKESMKDINKGVGIDYVIKNVIVPHLEKKRKEQK